MLFQCINSCGSYNDELTKGFIYDVVKTGDTGYHIKNYGWYEFSRFKRVKEFTLNEVLSSINEKEIYSNGIARIVKLNDQIIFLDGSQQNFLNDKFAYQGKLYSFAKAFNAYLKGRTIVSYKTNMKYKKFKNEDYYLECGHWYSNYKFPIEEMNYFWYIE